jgi:hypothetical protein
MNCILATEKQIAFLTIKLPKALSQVFDGVRMNEIDNHYETKFMAFVDQELEILPRSKSTTDSVGIAYMVAK